MFWCNHHHQGAHYLSLLKLHLLKQSITPLNAELNPICHLLALLGAHPFIYVGRIRVKMHRCG
jgi:hypothetical protein